MKTEYPDRILSASINVSDVCTLNKQHFSDNARVWIRPMINNIKKLRIDAGMSQEALADLAGTTKATIMKLEKGSMRLTQQWMVRIAKGLSCRPQDLIAEAGIESGSSAQNVQAYAKGLMEALQTVIFTMSRKVPIMKDLESALNYQMRELRKQGLQAEAAVLDEVLDFLHNGIPKELTAEAQLQLESEKRHPSTKNKR